MKIRTGDTIVVISGKDKGKTGAVTRVLPEERRVVVTGINMRTRHVKKTFEQAGRIIKYEAAIDISKVMVVDAKSGKPTRVGFQMKDGKKMRVSKRSGEEIIKVKPKKSEAVKKIEAEAPKKKSETPAQKKAEEAKPGREGKSQPFWKRMKFGASAIEDAEVSEQPQMQKDQTIPSQQLHVRKGARGS